MQIVIVFDCNKAQEEKAKGHHTADDQPDPTHKNTAVFGTRERERERETDMPGARDVRDSIDGKIKTFLMPHNKTVALPAQKPVDLPPDACCMLFTTHDEEALGIF